MNRLFAIIAFEVALIAIIGVLTSLVSETISIDSTTVWVTLVLVLLILVPTSWLRYKYENGDRELQLGIQIPDNINFSISTASLKNNSSLILTIIINGALFGFLSAYVSLLLSNDGFADSIVREIINWFRYMGVWILAHEIFGTIIVALASLVVMRRLSLVLGLIFCFSSSIVFSLTHIGIKPSQPFAETLFGNLITILLLSVFLRVLYPLLAKFIIDFWKNIFSS